MKQKKKTNSRSIDILTYFCLYFFNGTVNPSVVEKKKKCLPKSLMKSTEKKTSKNNLKKKCSGRHSINDQNFCIFFFFFFFWVNKTQQLMRKWTIEFNFFFTSLFLVYLKTLFFNWVITVRHRRVAKKKQFFFLLTLEKKTEQRAPNLKTRLFHCKAEMIIIWIDFIQIVDISWKWYWMYISYTSSHTLSLDDNWCIMVMMYIYIYIYLPNGHARIDIYIYKDHGYSLFTS